MWQIVPRLLSRPAARFPHLASAATIALSAAADQDPVGRDMRGGGPFGKLEEATLLSVLWAALLAVAAVAVATRGPTGTTPPFAIARELLAGGLAAALGEALFFPVEVVKVPAAVVVTSPSPNSMCPQRADMRIESRASCRFECRRAHEIRHSRAASRALHVSSVRSCEAEGLQRVGSHPAPSPASLERSSTTGCGLGSSRSCAGRSPPCWPWELAPMPQSRSQPRW